MGRIKEFAARLSHWLSTDKKTAREQRAEHVAKLRGQASAGAQRAASRVQDFRASERGQRAASKLNDLRGSDTAKRAESALHDLRTSEAGQKAEHALSDLRQREPVKKATDGARKVVHDLFSGGPEDSRTTGTSA